jgi:hypothetical protein
MWVINLLAHIYQLSKLHFTLYFVLAMVTINRNGFLLRQENSGSVKGVEFLDQLSDCYFLKKTLPHDVT